MKTSGLLEERMKISPLQKEWPASQTTEQTVQRLLWALWDWCVCVFGQAACAVGCVCSESCVCAVRCLCFVSCGRVIAEGLESWGLCAQWAAVSAVGRSVQRPVCRESEGLCAL